ncbi:MAG TPA: flagellar export chaperone FliS [Acidimicrobiales bacterium]|nr:flagellar export chaperone FliS [Acidimicrobiales bacterium]
MTTSQTEKLRERYLAEAIETAQPAVRLTMLFDALELDLRRADAAFDTNDLKAINDNLVHAQAILLTLRDTIKPELWEGAPRLIALYDFFLAELLRANLDKDRQRAADVAVLIGQVGGAWRKAAETAVVTGEERVGGVA